MNCENCNKRATVQTKFAKCSQCKVVSYCGKSCQIANWPMHGKMCAIIAGRAQYVKHANNRISGNVQIFAAWRNTQYVEITIDENIMDFISDVSFHIANMTAPQCENSIAADCFSVEKNITVLYKFLDFRAETVCCTGNREAILKNKEDPGDEYSIIFEH